MLTGMNRHRHELGFGVVELVLIVVIIAVLGVIGWVVYKDIASRTASTVHTQKSSPSTSTQTVDPYAGWKTYTSSFEKLSSKYPNNWTAAATDRNFGITGADALQLKSPSGAVTVSWFSAVQGIGGACDATIMPGSKKASPDALSACPYWYVLDKQKLKGADLYYVAGVETNDGSTFSPWCALQASNGILNSEGNIGYLLFKGRNNDFTQNGHDYGLQQAGLVCGKSLGDFGVQGLVTGTKSQATAFWSTPEARQVKLILLSASY
jgi:Tfp pilus assembly protein PilE